jgi:hypothetical protein
LTASAVAGGPGAEDLGAGLDVLGVEVGDVGEWPAPRRQLLVEFGDSPDVRGDQAAGPQSQGAEVGRLGRLADSGQDEGEVDAGCGEAAGPAAVGGGLVLGDSPTGVLLGEGRVVAEPARVVAV